jgi:hypothetical protein
VPAERVIEVLSELEAVEYFFIPSTQVAYWRWSR